MAIVEMKCPNCGGIIKGESSTAALICDYCNKAFVVREAINNYNSTVNNITNNQITNNIKADTVVISPEKDFVIRAGTLVKYKGESSVVHIPEGVKRIGDNAFIDGEDIILITELHLPSTIIDIFAIDIYRSELEKITISQNNGKYNCIGNCLIEKETKKLIFGCNSSIIPDDGSVTVIGEFAFSHCERMKSIFIPNNIEKIEENAFEYCKNLCEINFSDESKLKSIGGDAFKSCKNLRTIVIPASVEHIDDYAFMSCEKTTIYVVASEKPKMWGYKWNKTSIYGEHHCQIIWGYLKNDGERLDVDEQGVIYNIKNSTKTATVSRVDKSLINVIIKSEFKGCKVTAIDKKAFYGCTNLESVIIPDSIIGIGGFAFKNCEKLISIKLPKSLTNIDIGAFMGCRKLTEITIPGGIKSIKEATFAFCANLSNIKILSGITSIGKDAFHHCSLTEIEIPESVAHVAEDAFDSDKKIRKFVKQSKPRKCLCCHQKMPLFSKKCRCGAEYL